MQRLRTRDEPAHERRRRTASVAGRPSTVDAALVGLAMAVVLVGLFGPAVVVAFAVGTVAGVALAI